MLGFVLSAATAQVRDGAQAFRDGTRTSATSDSDPVEDAKPGFTYRNDISVRAGAAWQRLVDLNLLGPDNLVIDRREWSTSVRYAHVFADLPQDDAHRHDVSRRLLPAGHVAVELSDNPTLAAEPDEFRLHVSGAGLIAPGFALGGSITDVQGECRYYKSWGEQHFRETLHSTMVTAMADIWLSSHVVLRESAGGGRYTRKGETWLQPQYDGGMLSFGHALQWEISPMVSYSHSLRVDNWEDYRRVIDFVNTVEVAFSPAVVGTAGVRIAGFYTREVSDHTALGPSLGIRIHPVPYLYAEASASSLSVMGLFDQQDQKDILLAVGTRF